VIIIEIKDTESNTTCCYVKDFEFHEYIWSEGNFSCDCNRGIFFENCMDMDVTENPCGNKRYYLRVYDMYGDLLYSEREG
jgi:hypothetical protein